MRGRALERIWRITAIVMCAAVPVSFYALGDLTDAFPGVLTLRTEEPALTFGPRASAEDWGRPENEELLPASGAVGTPVDPADLDERMSALAELPVVDGGLAFSVVEAGTGTTLASREAATALVPASTLKLLTAAAVLREYEGDEVLTTRAVVQDGVITLVGGGDMTLSEEDLRALAEDAAALAVSQGAEEVSLVLDDGLLVGGPNPAWGDNGTAGGWVTPTASLALDEGWLDGEQYGPKSTDPAGDAAERFAALLREAGLTVTGGIEEGEAPVGAPAAEVRSAPLAELVRHTLLISDNTTAELLAHLVALSRGEETTPAGAAAAVEAEVRELAAAAGMPESTLAQLEIRDGSGLSRQNRVPSALLAAVLAEAASGTLPALEQILFDIPVAGLSGTLADRFDADGAEDAAGLVRGKTGYLGGAATLAGVAVLPDGRTVGYSIAVHGFDGADAPAARAAVDRVAAEIVQED
ncbi:D-alanyl-D-alanine carboxypeptidase [Brachybacterium saurashtrense]|uniref:D-alanyl-D-alanine carboxypeptidase n=2 Tax=Brachybacterium saurashtrense TaxID=556288 RepID=A0ABN5MN19_9MICO|nr:D-alanyl-D-alanine carboxypeptidase [Brachybacterium saurashtrense]AXK44813.1 D-alanyl-D-alanine carboxypeptidase [Brachybacterium saurashtrense]